MIRALGWATVGMLAAAAVFELVLAFRHEASPHGEGWVLLAAIVAMLVAGGLVRGRVGPIGLFAPAAALFVTARYYTGDPYYASTTFRRYADGGILPPTWIFVLLGLAVAAGVTTQLWRRTTPVETQAVLVLVIFTAFFMGTGH